MGSWSELDIDLSVKNDVSALDKLIDVCSDSDMQDIFEPAIRIAEGFKEAIEEGSKEGLHIIAEMTKDTESNNISDTSKHPYAQGILASSIQITPNSPSLQYTIGTSINHIYPMSVEYGADIFPVRKKMLKFQLLSGDIVFAPYVHVPPHPFVEPTFERTKRLIDNGVGVFTEVCSRMDEV